MESAVVKHIGFGLPQKRMPRKAKLVLQLITDCLNNKVVLDDYVLQDWWLQKIVKPRNRIERGKYLGVDAAGNNTWERINEYDLRVRQIKEHDGLLPGYYWSEAKYALKYHIGNLVVNGYLVVLPVIKLSEAEPAKQITA